MSTETVRPASWRRQLASTAGVGGGLDRSASRVVQNYPNSTARAALSATPYRRLEPGFGEDRRKDSVGEFA